MKLLYAALAAISVFLMVMINTITFATTPDEVMVSELTRHPEKWRLEVLEPDPFSSDEGELKSGLLKYFARAGTPTYTQLDHFFECLCLILGFSLVGLLRERVIQRRSQKSVEINLP